MSEEYRAAWCRWVHHIGDRAVKSFRTSLTILAALILASTVLAQQVPPNAVAPAGAAPQSKPADDQTVKTYDEQADARTQIAQALIKAKKENRRVLIQWGGNWCGWCRLLHALYKSDKEIARKLLYEYEVLYVDAGRPLGKNLDVAESYGADLKAHGFPYLTILDDDGKAIANQETSSLEIKDKTAKPGHDPKLVLSFLTDHQAAYQDAQKVLDDGLKQASQAGKHVFLHFGAPWCGWCHRLEDWMARDDVSSIMSKDLIDVKIDTERMIGGQELLTKFNVARTTGIPWFVILDARGNNLMDSNGPSGKNIGYPGTAEEIEHFRAMLTATAINLTPEDIRKVIAPLLEQAPPKK